MSINHYSSDTPETTLWWTQQQQAILMEPIQNPSTTGSPIPIPIPIHPSWPAQLYHHQPTWLNSHTDTPQEPPSTSMNPTSTPRFNLNSQDEDEDDDDNNVNAQPPVDDDQGATTSRSQQEGEDEKEPMFEKSLTPSDVGKLNRLVIPKQHAEKYFPLGAGGGDSVESKGLLLSFEDESGKCWRFRYSYWNSSQSYVLTKGWSRYVKEKRLDAGDVVLFERHRADAQRLFIGWRRRHPSGSAPAHVRRGGGHSKSSDGNSISNSKNNGVGDAVPVGWTRGFYPAHPYPTHQPFPYQPDCLHAGRGSQGQNQTTPVGNSSSSRVLRLFGVNMECQPDNDSGTSRPECSYNMSSTQGTATHHFYHHHHQPSYSSSNPHHHMDVNQMRNRQG